MTKKIRRDSYVAGVLMSDGSNTLLIDNRTLNGQLDKALATWLRREGDVIATPVRIVERRDKWAYFIERRRAHG